MPDEELDDAGMRSVEEQATGVDIEKNEVERDEVDECGEQEDYSNEYLTESSNKATNPPALCLNTEEVAKVFDEVLAYIIFQRKDLLDAYVALSFNEMKERRDTFHTPFVTEPFHCPAFLDEESQRPRIPTKDEYLAWLHGEGLKRYQAARNEWMIKNKYTVRCSSLLLCENLDQPLLPASHRRSRSPAYCQPDLLT